MMGWFSAVIERRTLIGWAIVAIVGAIATATLLALAGPSFADHSQKDYNDVADELAQLRQATAKYQDVNVALNDGYVEPGRCVPNMGRHFVHREDVLKANDFRVGVGGDPLQPEALLYVREATGEYKLVAVEWIVLYDTVTRVPNPETSLPTLVLGDVNESFHGPMPGHEPWPTREDPLRMMPWHYDLHAWIWKPNPGGPFDDFNAKVSCQRQ
jgi:hypothetical protein